MRGFEENIWDYEGEELTGEWRKLQNEELNDLYCLSINFQVIKLTRMKLAGNVACMGEKRGIYRVLVGRPGGRSPLGRPRCRWENNIKTDLQKVGLGYGMDRDGSGY